MVHPSRGQHQWQRPIHEALVDYCISRPGLGALHCIDNCPANRVAFTVMLRVSVNRDKIRASCFQAKLLVNTYNMIHVKCATLPAAARRGDGSTREVAWAGGMQLRYMSI